MPVLIFSLLVIASQDLSNTTEPTKDSNQTKNRVTLLDANDPSSVGTVLLNAGAHSGASYDKSAALTVTSSVNYGPDQKCGGYCKEPPDCAGPGMEACPFCVNNRCGPKAPKTCEAPCEKPEDCAGPGMESCPFCVNNKCGPKAAGCADACETADDCSGDPKCQFCVDHKCVADVCAAACESNNDCAGSPCPVCTNGKCEAPQPMHPIVPIYVPVGMMTPIYPNNPFHIKPPQPLLKTSGKWPNAFGDGTEGYWKHSVIEGYTPKSIKPKAD